MQAGVDHSTGSTLVFLDGDLQNDPADIPMLLEKLDEGYDVVSGWRKDRHDHFLSRRLPSRLRELDHLCCGRGSPARLRLHAQGLSP